MGSKHRPQFDAAAGLVGTLGALVIPVWYGAQVWTGRAGPGDHALAAVVLVVYGLLIAERHYAAYRTARERGMDGE